MTVGYPLPELSSFLKCRLLYKLVERRDYFSRHADVQDSKIALHQQKNKKVSKTQQALMTCSIKGSDGMGCNKYLHCAWLVSDPQLFATVGWNSQLPSLVQASSASARLFCSIGRQQLIEHQCIYFYVDTTFPKGTLATISAGLTTLSKSFVKSSWEKKSLRFLHGALLVRLLPLTNPVNSSLHLPPSWFFLVAVTDCTKWF